ncbi:homeobox protein 4 isoform X1 [Hydra vulgaris]|uniref:homeobox protein 4 isoform X1 n=1 Tax=Hydra vulgaris TaxID=6087 RepID=UPI001F5F4BA7|nr:homeobox protein 4-like isoform X1 [Hydra vulgaris]
MYETDHQGNKLFIMRPGGHDIKKVVDFRLDNGKRYYKVKWESSWEPEDNLLDYQVFLDQFWDFVNRVKSDQNLLNQPQRKKPRIIITDGNNHFKSASTKFMLNTREHIESETVSLYKNNSLENSDNEHNDQVENGFFTQDPQRTSNHSKSTPQILIKTEHNEIPPDRPTMVGSLPEKFSPRNSTNSRSNLNTMNTDLIQGKDEKNMFGHPPVNDYEKSYQEIVDESGQPMLYLTGHPNNHGKKLDFIVSKLNNKEDQARNIDSPEPKSPNLHLGARTIFPKKKRTPTNCKICFKAFNYKSNMIRHMRAIHKNNDVTSVSASPTNNTNFSKLTKYENSMVMLDNTLVSPNNFEESLSFNENIDSTCANSDSENDKNDNNEIDNSEAENELETDLSQNVKSDYNNRQKINSVTTDNSTLSKSSRKRKSLSSCKICQKQFNYKSNMYRHLRVVHNKQKTLHTCSMCPKTFTETSNLRRHLLNTHKL